MKILHISDTHGMHDQLTISTDIDMIIHSGDCSNHPSSYLNEMEVRKFVEWYSYQTTAYKIYVAGNHDTSIERKLINKEFFTDRSIIYLENESVDIQGIKIWGSPVTPTFGQWAFMKDRAKTHKIWDTIPDDTDIIVTHGPPKNVLDLSYDRQNNMEACGDKSLFTAIQRVQPQLHMFGHIHNFKDIVNQGTRTVSGLSTVFSNGSCVEDAKFDKGLISFGNTFNL